MYKDRIEYLKRAIKRTYKHYTGERSDGKRYQALGPPHGGLQRRSQLDGSPLIWKKKKSSNAPSPVTRSPIGSFIRFTKSPSADV